MKKLIPFLSAILLSLLSIKVTIFGAGIGDAISILGLVGLHGYKEYLNTKIIKDPTEELRQELEKMKSEVSNVSVAISQRSKSTPINFKF